MSIFGRRPFPEFCTSCGTPLAWLHAYTSYDAQTGAPTRHERLGCPGSLQCSSSTRGYAVKGYHPYGFTYWDREVRS